MARRRKNLNNSSVVEGIQPTHTNGEPTNPDDSSRTWRIAAAAVFVVLVLVFIRTMAPGMQTGDGLELAASAHVLGVPHPTGYPLYMLLLKIFLLLTVAGEVIVRTSIFSALCMAASAAITLYILRDYLRDVFPAWPEKLLLLAAASGAITVALLRFHWSNGITTEVYAFEFLLMLLFLRSAQLFMKRPEPARLILAVVWLGAGLSHHRLSIIMIIPFLIIAYKAIRHWDRKEVIRGMGFISLIIIGFLSLYLYLPLRASAKPPINWGNCVNLQATLNHISGKEYLGQSLFRKTVGTGFSSAEYSRFAARQSTMLLMDLAGQISGAKETFIADVAARRAFVRATGSGLFLSAVLLVLLCTGFVTLVRQSRDGIVILLLMAIQSLFIIFAYNILDIRDYYLFIFWTAWILIWIGGLTVASIAWKRFSISRLRPESGYALFLVPCIVGALNWKHCNRSGDVTAEALSAIVLPDSREIMPKDSLLLTGGDHDIFTCWYRQLVRKERTDVLVFGSNFIWKSWYPAFFTDEQQANYGLKFFSKVAHNPREFAEQLNAGVIDANVQKRPVFTSISDELVLRVLAEKHTITPVQQAVLSPLNDYTPESVMTLYRIAGK